MDSLINECNKLDRKIYVVLFGSKSQKPTLSVGEYAYICGGLVSFYIVIAMRHSIINLLSI
jgi:hypothetical protein